MKNVAEDEIHVLQPHRGAQHDTDSPPSGAIAMRMFVSRPKAQSRDHQATPLTQSF
jgi:hypothetical protein